MAYATFSLARNSYFCSSLSDVAAFSIRAAKKTVYHIAKLLKVQITSEKGREKIKEIHFSEQNPLVFTKCFFIDLFYNQMYTCIVVSVSIHRFACTCTKIQCAAFQ